MTVGRQNRLGVKLNTVNRAVFVMHCHNYSFPVHRVNRKHWREIFSGHNQ